MMHLLLALLVSVPGTWSWDQTGIPAATAGYEFCWSYDVAQFSRALCADVGRVNAYLPSIELEALWGVEQTPGALLFIQICAYNYVGTAIQYDERCAAFAPIPPDWQCPDGACLP